MSKKGPKPRAGGVARTKVGCRLNESELQKLARLVKESGVSMAEYIRARILKKREPVIAEGEGNGFQD